MVRGPLNRGPKNPCDMFFIIIIIITHLFQTQKPLKFGLARVPAAIMAGGGPRAGLGQRGSGRGAESCARRDMHLHTVILIQGAREAFVACQWSKCADDK